MYIHDDADLGAVVTKTIAAILAGTRQIGKADQSIRPDQIAELETAIRKLQDVVELKKR